MVCYSHEHWISAAPPELKQAVGSVLVIDCRRTTSGPFMLQAHSCAPPLTAVSHTSVPQSKITYRAALQCKIGSNAQSKFTCNSKRSSRCQYGAEKYCWGFTHTSFTVNMFCVCILTLFCA
ncbi:hypothetical protein ATANTOWER_030793 [Ataeniobius toweri]|uniref:Uncharacterized protein n=1 Tax=Ataeniobius toweri TaxID=208326 RepID=A0ABU7BTM6_9TELE|nr:hypothetical protein [Ataeniobius toweri]